jgi:hypothetical protein
MQVKIVRESMNRMIEVWKQIPDAEEDECSSAAPAVSLSQRRSFTGEDHSLHSCSCYTSSACTDLVNFVCALQEIKNRRNSCVATSKKLLKRSCFGSADSIPIC